MSKKAQDENEARRKRKEYLRTAPVVSCEPLRVAPQSQQHRAVTMLKAAGVSEAVAMAIAARCYESVDLPGEQLRR